MRLSVPAAIARCGRGMNEEAGMRERYVASLVVVLSISLINSNELVAQQGGVTAESYSTPSSSPGEKLLDACDLAGATADVQLGGVWSPLEDVARLLQETGASPAVACEALKALASGEPTFDPSVLDALANAAKGVPIPPTESTAGTCSTGEQPEATSAEAPTNSSLSEAFAGPRPHGSSTVESRMRRAKHAMETNEAPGIAPSEDTSDVVSITALQASFVAAGCADDETAPAECAKHPYARFANGEAPAALLVGTEIASPSE